MGACQAFTCTTAAPGARPPCCPWGTGGELRVEAKHRGRLRLCGGLDSLQINATISHLERSDTGLYMWELSYTEENSSHQILICDQKLFLLVEGTGTCQCSHLYTPLLWSIFVAVGLLLLLLIWLGVDKCVKVKDHPKPQLPVPIYEEMTRKQQTTGISQNTHEAPLHPQEPDFPVYANPNFRQPQDNYYACPRQLALRAT